jgi:hypothetical protein
VSRAKGYTDEMAARDKAAIFDRLREVRERYARGECDAEGRPTAFGIALRGAVKVDPDA